MQAVLVMFRSDGERRSFSVTRDMTVIGRREDCDLRIPLGDISRKHARLVRDGDSLRLEDLGSSNGTFLNGQRVQEAALNPGDSVQLGPVVFVLQIDGYPGDDELQPVVADTTHQSAAEPAEADEIPVSSAAQSDGEDDLGTLDAMPPLEDDDGLGLDELHPMEEDHAASSGSIPLHEAHAESGAPIPMEEVAEEELSALPLEDAEPLGEHIEAAGDDEGDLDMLSDEEALEPLEEEIAPIQPAGAANAVPSANGAGRTPPPPARTPPPARMNQAAVNHEPFSMPPAEADDAVLGSFSDEAEFEELPESPEIPPVNASAAPASHMPASHHAAAGQPVPLSDEADFDIETLPEIGEDEILDLLPDEPGHLGNHEDVLDLDLGLDTHQHPHA